MSKEDILVFVMVAHTQNKTVKIEMTCRVLKLKLKPNKYAKILQKKVAHQIIHVINK